MYNTLLDIFQEQEQEQEPEVVVNLATEFENFLGHEYSFKSETILIQNKGMSQEDGNYRWQRRNS